MKGLLTMHTKHRQQNSRTNSAAPSSSSFLEEDQRKRPLIESLRSSGGDDIVVDSVPFRCLPSSSFSVTTLSDPLKGPPALQQQLQKQQQQSTSTTIAATYEPPVDSAFWLSESRKDAMAYLEQQQQQQNAASFEIMGGGPDERAIPWYEQFAHRWLFRRQNKGNNNSNNDGEEEEDEELFFFSTKLPVSAWQNHPLFRRMSGMIYFFIFFLTAAGMVYGVHYQIRENNKNSYRFYNNRHNNNNNKNWGNVHYNVAFLGNTYFVVNDIPRLLEALSDDVLTQNSCLRPGGSLSDLFGYGNGMYKLWQTEDAMVSINDTIVFYDFGYCTVSQMLAGYDDSLDDPYFYYYSNDGLNPCLQDSQYMSIMDSLPTVEWDYIVLADQTKRMAIADARNETVDVLKYGYGPVIAATSAIPVIVDTHAFWSQSSNMTGLGDDIPSFTKKIYQGVSEYVSALSSVLPKAQKPIVAPIGLAYLVIYEEQPDIWTTLFLEDTIHASISGSYLLAVVLYMTLLGRTPPEESYYLPRLFANSRKIIGKASDENNEYPNFDTAEYLRNVAKRVVLQGYLPSSFKSSR
jgi:hypothetical protein